MKPGPRALVLLVTLLATAALGWLSRAPYNPPGGEHAVLRLSWRLRGERIESCRTRTEAELAALPAHMRTPEVCEARLLSYRLVQQVGDAAPDTATVVPGGARGDRPLFVLRETPLAPGPRRVRVTLAREDGAGESLAFDQVIDAAPGVVELITLDPEAGRLVHRTTATR